MSPRRVLALFVAALLVIAAGVWLSTRQHVDHVLAAGQPVMPDFKKALNDVTEVRFAKADGTHSTLRRQGADWLVVERNFAADAGRVRKLLLDAAAMKVVEEKTSNPERYADLSVQDVAAPAATSSPQAKASTYDYSATLSATRIDVVTPTKTWTLINGKSAGGKSGYVRVAGSKQSVLATPRLDADADPGRWLDKTIANIPEARVQSVAVRPAKGPAYTVARAKREDQNFSVSNIPKARKLSHEGAGNALATALESLSLDDVRAPAAAASANLTVETSHATYHTFDGMTVELIGRKESAPALNKDDPKVENHFITVSASSTDKATQPEAQKLTARLAGKQFEISSYKYDAIFKPLEDLLEPLPSKAAK